MTWQAFSVWRVLEGTPGATTSDLVRQTRMGMRDVLLILRELLSRGQVVAEGQGYRLARRGERHDGPGTAEEVRSGTR